MKKKILSIVLALIILPTIFLFTGCNKGYSLSNLETDYKNCFVNNEMISYESNEIVFDYSSYPYFSSQVQSSTSNFMYVKNFNIMLNNITAFANKYIGQISVGNYNVDKNQGKEIKSQVKAFATAVDKIEVATSYCADQLEFTKNVQDPICLNKLKVLLDSYIEAYDVAYNLNSSLMKIYFADTNIINYANQNTINPLSALVDTKFEARLKQQIVNTTKTFVEMNICDSSITSLIANNETLNFGGKINFYNSYALVVAALDKTYSETDIEAISNDADTLSRFKENIIKLNNIQAVLNNEYNFYYEACNNINYIKTLKSANTSYAEQIDVNHIENFNYINNQYDLVLTNILNTLGV